MENFLIYVIGNLINRNTRGQKNLVDHQIFHPNIINNYLLPFMEKLFGRRKCLPECPVDGPRCLRAKTSQQPRDTCLL